MSFEPDTNDIRIRQLKEEIAKIREEQFARAFPTNNVGSPSVVNSDSGIPAPAIGIDSIIPAVVRISKDTGVIDKLNYKQQVTNKAFVIGEIVTGMSSGATATIGDIDIITVDDEGTLTLVSSSITGSFTNNENLNGDIDGDAKVDGTLFTQTGRGHINAGAGSIIADSDKISSPFEIHFIDNAQQDGQTIYLRAQDGQTITMRKPTTTDGTTGNLDLDQSFDIIENAIVFFQYQVASNASETGGWVPQISDVSAGTGGLGGTFGFPILYPKENLGTQNGVIDLALNQSDGHYKQITLDGDASLTFSNLPPSTNGFKFYVLTIQDGTGGHVYTDLPDSVLFESDLLSQLQTGAGDQTLWQFSTADGGVNWHASVINPEGSVGQSQTPWLSDIDADTFDLFNADKIIFFGAGGFSFPTDASLQAISTSGTGIQVNVPSSQTNRWYNDGKLFMELDRIASTSHQLNLFDEGLIERTAGITFSHLAGPPALSAIRPVGLELEYSSGQGTGQGGFHGFRVANPTFPQFEIREDVVRSNVDFDVVTNDIINIDQAQFDSAGGFEPLVNHGERRITGGQQGIEMNIPKITPFAGGFNIFFENDAQDNSDLEYRFDKTQLTMFRKPIVDTLGLLFVNGGSLLDTGNRIVLTTGQVPGPLDPQTLEFQVSNVTKVEIDDSAVGGFRMFTDINMRSFNIFGVDVLRYTIDSGVIGFSVYGSAVEAGGSFLKWSVPSLRSYQWQVNLDPVASLSTAVFRMLSNSNVFSPSIISDGAFIVGQEHILGDVGIVDGEHRLVNDGAGSLDVIFGSGGNLVNLSNLAGGGGGNIWSDPVDSSLIPDTDNLYDIGSSSLRFRSGFFRSNMNVIGVGNFGSLNTPSITGFASIGGGMQVDGDFTANGKEITLGNSLQDSIRPRGKIRPFSGQFITYGPVNEFASGPRPKLTQVGQIDLEQIILIDRRSILGDTPASPALGPIIRGADIDGQKLGWFSAFRSTAILGTKGAMQIPFQDRGFAGNASNADSRFTNEQGCIALENTQPFNFGAPTPPNVPRLIVRAGTGVWYQLAVGGVPVTMIPVYTPVP